MMTGESEKTWQGHWRKNAVIKNIFGEMPILGPFFLEPRLWDAVPKSFHAAFMFFGGVVLMSTDPFNLMPMPESDNVVAKSVGVGTLYMGIGMWAGAVSYHAVDHGVKKLRSSLSSTPDNLAENKVALLPR